MSGQAAVLAREAKPHEDGPPDYVLDGQVGFVLRQAQQRHAVIFASAFGDDVTPLQWAATAKLAELGECSQNQLGRLIATDVATIKGVAERLARRGLLETHPDPEDRRRLLLRLTEAGLRLYRDSAAKALDVSAATLAPLQPEERGVFLQLLAKLR